jgi:L-alanine-DL-glutamate epimerase-like enolase superfamily enzyme
LVDEGCATPRDAALFLERGAVALSAKPGRVGVRAARAIARQAEAAGARTVAGFNGESSLGALLGLQQVAAVPERSRVAPAELTFFLLLREQVLAEALEIRDGAVTLPGASDLAGLVDWDRVRRFAL